MPDPDRPNPPTLPRVTFWPRPAPAGSPFDRDFFCEKCGYNLRGLPRDTSTCPECGATVSLKRVTSSQLPWGQRETRGFLDAYWATVKLVLTQPGRFRSELWEGGRLSERDANKFRWATILHAYVPLMGLWLALLPVPKPMRPGERLVPYAVGMSIIMLWWLHRSTRLLIAFLRRQTINVDVYRRLVALAHYAPAALALTPVHLGFFGLVGAIKLLVTGPGTGPGAEMLRVAVFAAWVGFGAVQLGLWWFASMGLVREASAGNDAELLAYGMIFAAIWALHALAYLVVLPATLAFVAVNVLNLI